MGKALGRFWDTTFGKDGAYGKAIEIRKQAWEAAGRFLTEAWKKTLRFAQDVGAWYHENIGKMIYRNIAWYDKQVLQPLKRDPLTFIGRTIAAALGVLAVALCVIYCYGWVVNVAWPAIKSWWQGSLLQKAWHLYSKPTMTLFGVEQQIPVSIAQIHAYTSLVDNMLEGDTLGALNALAGTVLPSVNELTGLGLPITSIPLFDNFCCD